MSALAPSSTRLPAYMTATRSATCETSERSCEMKSIANPNLWRRSLSRSRICCWMVTSSAVVGSSALFRIGDSDVTHTFHGFAPCFLFRNTPVSEHGFRDLVADAHDRIESGHRLLEDHGHARAAEFAQPIGGQTGEMRGSAVAILESDFAFDGGGGREQAHDGKRGDGFA